MPAPSDLVHQTTTGTGTGNLALTSVNGKRSFLTAYGTGGTNTFDYYISNRGAAEWERGTGHEASGSLVRDTVIASSNANAAVNFSAGTKDITNDIPAANQVYNENSTVTDGHGVLFDGTTGRKLKTAGQGLATTDTVRFAKVGVGMAATKDLDVTGEIRASVGILFGTDTAAANTLDDYEEGTWTVNLYDASTGGNVSATSSTGTYVKIGSLVIAVIDNLNNISTSGMTSGNQIYFTLPVANSTTALGGSALVNDVTLTSAVSVIPGYGAATRGRIQRVRSAAGTAFTTVGDLTSGTSDFLAITCIYRA